MPLSVFNKQVIEEAGKLSASKERISRGHSDGSRVDSRKVRFP